MTPRSAVFTIQEDGSLLLFGAGGQVLHWRDGDVRGVIDAIAEVADSRFNDVIADPEGRVYCGTMPSETHAAQLFRLDTDGTLTTLFDGIGLSNGMSFTHDLGTMFHTDTNFRAIYRLDYDRGSGALANRRVIVRTPEDAGGPDGMTVDAEDTIWSARWGGWGLFRYSSDGRLLGKVPMPVAKVSSITFGGPDLRTAYVTTATGGEPRDASIGQLAGSLFSLDLGVPGRPPFRSRIRVV